MKRFSLIFLGALVLMLAVVLPGYASVGQPVASQGATDLSVSAASAQGVAIQAVQADHDGQTIIASKGDDDDDKHGDKDDDKNDDRHDDDWKTPQPTKMPDHNDDDDHGKTPEPTKTPDHDDMKPEPTHTPGHDDDMSPDPTHTPGAGKYHEFRGRIEAMNGNVWIIDGRTVMVTDRTRFEAEHGPLAVGSMVEVKAMPQPDGTYIANKIEARDQDRSKSTSGSDDAMGSQAQVQTQVQSQVMTQQQVQLTPEQQQAMQAINAILQWLMQTFNLDLSQVMSMLTVDAQ